MPRNFINDFKGLLDSCFRLMSAIADRSVDLASKTEWNQSPRLSADPDKFLVAWALQRGVARL
jgi:hypothetical protein